MSDLPKTKPVCQLDAEGFYVCQTVSDQDPMQPENWLIPAGCIVAEPPEVKPEQAAKWQPEKQAWQYLPDYRGKTAYRTDNGQPETVETVGELPAHLTLIAPPGELHQWNGKAWALSKEAAAVVKAEQQAEMWERIKAKRAQSRHAGIYINSIKKWMHSDADSRMQYTFLRTLDKLPENLGVLGGGNIGLEFAGLYNKLGSKVTVLDALDTFLPRAEPSIAALAKQYMEEDGIELLQNIRTTEIKNDGDQVLVVTENETYRFDALLYATGRKPNVEPLQLENTDIELTERGAIKVDKHCQTNVPGVFAVGDVNGGLQFTYISLDDFRVVYSYLAGDGSYTLEDRLNVPNTMFITPALSQVGLTESQAADLKLPYAVKEIPVAAMPRGHVNGDLRGAFKAVVNTETKEILGASIFSEGSQEIINIITVAMDNKIPYTYFTKQIFTHPTLAENLNDLFAI